MDTITTDNATNEIMFNKDGAQKEVNHDNAHTQQSRHGNRHDETFEEFSSNTTLHGVRYIGDRDSFLPRRLIWLAIVLLSASLFTIQVVDRVQYYLESPITVNFKVNYNRSLTFPAITICNQNLFRVTVAYEHQLIPVIEEMFGDKMIDSAMVDYTTTLDVLYTQLAHTKEDLIVQCYWGNRKCSAENFTLTLTSHGLCYTFNKVDSLDEAYTVEASGVDHGLRLILNTEKYERMTGPHQTDGIKLIATDQSEIPRVEEIGLAISAGAHAFVGLGVVSLNNLEPPYGRCGSHDLMSTDRYTPDSCLLECKTKYVVSICKCRHFYMPDLTGNTRICNVRDFHECLRNTINIFNDGKDALCQCPASCVYNIYETSVSYAKKSEWESVFNDDLDNLPRRREVHNTLNYAKEINSRMNIKDVTELNRSVSHALHNLDLLASFISNLGVYTGNNGQTLFDLNIETNNASKRRDSLFNLQLFIVEKNFIGGRDAMEESAFGVLCQSYREFLTDIFHKTNFLLNQNNNGPNAIVTHMLLDGLLTNKINIALTARYSYKKLLHAYDQGDPLLNHTYRQYNHTIQKAAIPTGLLHKTLYDNDISNDSFLNIDDIDRVLMGLYNIDMLIDNIYQNNTQNIDMLNVSTLGKEISDACEVYLDKKGLFYAEVIEKPAHILKQRKDALSVLNTNYKMAYESVNGHLETIHLATLDAESNTLPPLKEMLEKGRKYIESDLKQNITKLDLAFKLGGAELALNVRNLEMMLANIKTKLIGITDSLPILLNRLYDMWGHMLQFNDDTYEYDTIMDDWTFAISYSERGSDITRTLNPMASQFERTTAMIETVDHLAIEYVKHVMKLMETYVNSLKMGEEFYKDNFLEVDVYFKELRSEQIDQQKAYDEFALLCDIGGSMGLFIGGSAITFFEVVDFFIIRCLTHKLFRIRH